MKLCYPFFALFFILLMHGCREEKPYDARLADPSYLHRSVRQLTDVIVLDIFSPPVASRIYSYSSIAAYETSIQGALQENPSFTDSTGYISLAGKLNGFHAAPPPPEMGTWNVQLASIHAFLTVGKTLTFSVDSISKFQNEIYGEMRTSARIPRDIYDNSMTYGKLMADFIITWSGTDSYKQTRTFPKYSVTEDPSKWQPTPPAYMDGIEPHWNKIRPFILDSASQFAPLPPTVFSSDKESQFYKEALEVYNATNNAHPDYTSRIAIARFWDCNPYVANQRGHLMVATKKITPGGHWMGITAQMCRQKNLSYIESARAYAFVAITLFEGFISCWDEKYRSRLVRPETYINTYIDQQWQPNLQTPPFPEYTSGHSVISSATGELLTALLGDNIAYTDSVEVEYGLPMRSFTSFRQAYQEAAISRMYGGIHYRPAIENGIEQGKKVGSLVIERLIPKK